MFASCIYCGWRLDGEVRGAIEDAIILPSSSLSPSPAATPVSKVGGVGARSGGVTSTHADRDKLNKCGHCLKPLPRCSICLMLLGSGMDVSPAEVDSPIANRRSDANKTETTTGVKTDGAKSAMLDESRFVCVRRGGAIYTHNFK